MRLDSGVRAGSEIGIHYDPLLAKVIAWAPDRTSASLALAGALARARVHGLTTNRDLLVNVLRSPAFLAGETDTGFLDRHGLDVLAAPLLGDAQRRLHAVAAALAGAALRRAAAPVLAGLPSGWRNNPTVPQTTSFDGLTVHYRLSPSGLVADVDGEPVPARLLSCDVLTADQVQVALEHDGVRTSVDVLVVGSRWHTDSAHGAATFVEQPRFPDPVTTVAPGSLTAAMPGTVTWVVAAVGDRVRAGDLVVVLEAMKMEHPVTAPAAGVVTGIAVAAGQQVTTGAVLAVVDAVGGREERGGQDRPG